MRNYGDQYIRVILSMIIIQSFVFAKNITKYYTILWISETCHTIIWLVLCLDCLRKHSSNNSLSLLFSFCLVLLSCFKHTRETNVDFSWKNLSSFYQCRRESSNLSHGLRSGLLRDDNDANVHEPQYNRQ